MDNENEIIRIGELLLIGTVAGVHVHAEVRGVGAVGQRPLLGRLAMSEAEWASIRLHQASSYVDWKQRALEAEEALMLETGPHCSSCGQAIDPDWCHCGGRDCNPMEDGHSFCPMGCICGYAEQDWPRIANGLREQLWRARREIDELKAKGAA